MKQYIDKSALVAEIERITDEQQEICKADVALGKAPDSKNIEVIYQFQQFTKFLDTLEVKEIGVYIGPPEGDYNSKTVQFIDADGNIKEITFNKAQNGKSALEAIKEKKIDNQNCVKPADKVEPIFNVGDKIQYSKGCGTIMTIEKIENGEYISADNMGHTTIESGNKWHLVNTVEQNPAWSEEDKDYYDAIIAKLEVTQDDALLTDNQMKFLKSLKDRVQAQNTWKPSKEQMNTLGQWLKDNQYKGDARYCYPIINSLYQDLLKLRE